MAKKERLKMYRHAMKKGYEETVKNVDEFDDDRAASCSVVAASASSTLVMKKRLVIEPDIKKISVPATKAVLLPGKRLILPGSSVTAATVNVSPPSPVEIVKLDHSYEDDHDSGVSDPTLQPTVKSDACGEPVYFSCGDIVCTSEVVVNVSSMPEIAKSDVIDIDEYHDRNIYPAIIDRDDSVTSPEIIQLDETSSGRVVKQSSWKLRGGRVATAAKKTSGM